MTSVLLLLLVGCRFSEPPPPVPLQQALEQDPVLAAARRAGPAPYRLAVAPLEIAFDPHRASKTPAKHHDAPDPELFRGGVVEAIQETALFDRVEARGRGDQDAVALAWGASDDLVLKLTLKHYQQEYLGHSNYIPWFLVYAFWIWPAWWMPVDHYGTGLEVRAELRSVQGGVTPLLDRVYTIRAGDVAQELTPSDRELAGFLDWGALYNVEASLEPSNWAAIERCVAPHAWRKFQLELLRDLAATTAPLRSKQPEEREQVLSRIRKRFAISIGVTKYADPTLGAAPYAARDAEAMAKVWASKPGGSLTLGRDLNLVVGEAATRAGVLDAIAAVSSRSAPSDEVVIYLSALGTTLASVAPVGSAEPAILLHDAAATRLNETALTLKELSRALDLIPAARVLVIVDASFAGGEGGRSLASDRPGPTQADLRKLMQREGRAVLFAAAPGQTARVLSGAKAGLFSEVLRRGLSGAADTDENGRVELRELVSFTDRVVRERSGLEGFAQDPLALGATGLELGWPR